MNTKEEVNNASKLIDRLNEGGNDLPPLYGPHSKLDSPAPWVQ